MYDIRNEIITGFHCSLYAMIFSVCQIKSGHHMVISPWTQTLALVTTILKVSHDSSCIHSVTKKQRKSMRFLGTSLTLIQLSQSHSPSTLNFYPRPLTSPVLLEQLRKQVILKSRHDHHHLLLSDFLLVSKLANET